MKAGKKRTHVLTSSTTRNQLRRSLRSRLINQVSPNDIHAPNGSPERGKNIIMRDSKKQSRTKVKNTTTMSRLDLQPSRKSSLRQRRIRVRSSLHGELFLNTRLQLIDSSGNVIADMNKATVVLERLPEKDNTPKSEVNKKSRSRKRKNWSTGESEMKGSIVKKKRKIDKVGSLKCRDENSRSETKKMQLVQKPNMFVGRKLRSSLNSKSPATSEKIHTRRSEPLLASTPKGKSPKSKVKFTIPSRRSARLSSRMEVSKIDLVDKEPEKGYVEKNESLSDEEFDINIDDGEIVTSATIVEVNQSVMDICGEEAKEEADVENKVERLSGKEIEVSVVDGDSNSSADVVEVVQSGDAPYTQSSLCDELNELITSAGPFHTSKSDSQLEEKEAILDSRIESSFEIGNELVKYSFELQISETDDESHLDKDDIPVSDPGIDSSVEVVELVKYSAELQTTETENESDLKEKYILVSDLESSVEVTELVKSSVELPVSESDGDSQLKEKEQVQDSRDSSCEKVPPPVLNCGDSFVENNSLAIDNDDDDEPKTLTECGKQIMNFKIGLKNSRAKKEYMANIHLPQRYIEPLKKAPTNRDVANDLLIYPRITTEEWERDWDKKKRIIAKEIFAYYDMKMGKLISTQGTVDSTKSDVAPSEIKSRPRMIKWGAPLTTVKIFDVYVEHKEPKLIPIKSSPFPIIRTPKFVNRAECYRSKIAHLNSKRNSVSPQAGPSIESWRLAAVKALTFGKSPESLKMSLPKSPRPVPQRPSPSPRSCGKSAPRFLSYGASQLAKALESLSPKPKLSQTRTRDLKKWVEAVEVREDAGKSLQELVKGQDNDLPFTITLEADGSFFNRNEELP